MLDNVRQTLEEYGQQLIDEYKNNLSSSGHSATGNLANSISFTIDVSDGQIQLDLELADYWKFVEEGRGPGKMPPIDSILSWVRMKHILPRESHGKLPTERDLAFLIARKIGRFGIKGTNDLERAKQTVDNIFINRLADALAQDFDTEAYNMIKASGIAL